MFAVFAHKDVIQMKGFLKDDIGFKINTVGVHVPSVPGRAILPKDVRDAAAPQIDFSRGIAVGRITDLNSVACRNAACTA